MSDTERRNYDGHDLSRLMSPRLVAVVGASDTPKSFGERTLSNMADFDGEVVAVNPKYRTLLGRACVPSLADLPRSPDCVVLCVARPMVHRMIEACGAVGAGAAIVYASGFSETGQPEQVAAQEDLATLARQVGVRLAGPNCVGLANTRLRAGLNFMPDYAGMGHRRGPVAITSQSGALGYTVLQGMARGIGFSHFLTVGNSSDIDVCDYVSALAEDDDTRAIVCLMEGVKSGERFLAAARKSRDAGKALIVYKSGNGETSRKAAMSHTGTMVGSSDAYRAAFHEAGCVAIDNLEAVLETAKFFAASRAPSAGRGVGVLSTSGGAAVIAADMAERHEVPLPPLAPATEAALATVVPDFGSIANPADLTSEVLKKVLNFQTCLDAFLADPGYSALVIPMVFAHESSAGARASMVTGAAARTERPLCIAWMNEWYQGPGSEAFDADARVTVFRSTDRCFATLRAWLDWHAHDAPAASGRRAPPGAAEVARAAIEAAKPHGGTLGESASKRVLAAYGIPVPAEELAADPGQAAAAASRMGFPVVAKIASADIPHKTEVGGIRLSLRSAAEVEAAASEILASAHAHAPMAAIDGISVQRMLPPGIELVVGIKQDLQFGPLIAVGLGGVTVELLRDTAIRLAPVGPPEALAMLRALKTFPLLAGYRGAPGVDLDRLVDVVCRLSELGADLRDVIEEIDVNPIIAGPAGAIAADALVVLRTS